MNLLDRLGKWYDFFDKEELNYLLKRLTVLYAAESIMPSSKTIFKAFECCPFDKCNTIMLLQDPYSQKGAATGIALGNSADTISLSPSLQKLKEAVPKITEHFDNTLESWCNQGVLMLNSALTVQEGKPNSHALMWRPFITYFLKQYSEYNKNVVYVLFGKQAQNYKPYILYSGNICEVCHPSYLVREKLPMPDIFTFVNNALVALNKTPINWNVRK